MTDCVHFLLYLALYKLSLMLLINYYYYENNLLTKMKRVKRVVGMTVGALRIKAGMTGLHHLD